MKKTLLVDADSLIYKGACLIQSNPIIVTHELSKRKVRFESKTAFNEWLEGKGKAQGYCKEMFTFDTVSELKEDISHALLVVKNKIDSMINLPWVDSVRLFIAGEGNYRKELATIAPYKGNRPPKPVAFNDVVGYIKSKYKNIVTVCDGEESEDTVAILAMKEYQKAKETRNKDDMGVVFGHIDKDCMQIPGWHYNYDKSDNIFWVTDKEANQHFYRQMLIGDRGTDNIRGCEVLAAKIKEKYGLRNSKGGIGDKGADTILSGADSEKEMARRVRECYMEGYGDSWESVIRENGVLLRLRRKEGEVWDILEHFEKLGVT